MMLDALSLDPDLVQRYDRSGPRYTSYPPATAFSNEFTEHDYRAAALASNQTGDPEPLSLYFHIPFCATVCFYCACNKIITNNRAHSAPSVKGLKRELALQARLFDPRRTVEQLHWGGGTPTFLSVSQMADLMAATRQAFSLREDDGGEYSIEIDPRTVSARSIQILRALGFNRISMGVQDFDPEVQRAVNRIQTQAQTARIVAAARTAGFRSVSMDLIYGLPFQSAQRFARTLDQVVALSPDRVAVFNYAHLPHLFKTQQQIDAGALPCAQEKLRILGLTIERLQAEGYVYIGMDHFARPDDELARALNSGTLQRNFQGFSSYGHCELVALGITAIGSLGTCYSQNVRTLEEYYERLDQGRLPVLRGVTLSEDDQLRRQVIARLICHGRIHKCAITSDFDSYFACELDALAQLEDDGLITVDRQHIEVRPKGRLLIRNICMVFDRYLKPTAGQTRFSKAI